MRVCEFFNADANVSRLKKTGITPASPILLPFLLLSWELLSAL